MYPEGYLFSSWPHQITAILPKEPIRGSKELVDKSKSILITSWESYSACSLVALSVSQSQHLSGSDGGDNVMSQHLPKDGLRQIANPASADCNYTSSNNC
jgi:hypothetical protein